MTVATFWSSPKKQLFIRRAVASSLMVTEQSSFNDGDLQQKWQRVIFWFSLQHDYEYYRLALDLFCGEHADNDAPYPLYKFLQDTEHRVPPPKGTIAGSAATHLRNLMRDVEVPAMKAHMQLYDPLRCKARRAQVKSCGGEQWT